MYEYLSKCTYPKLMYLYRLNAIPFKYLPDFFKDFHDEKDVMKAFHDLYKDYEEFKKLPKLQKIKSKKISFFDIKDTIREYKEKMKLKFPL